MSTVNEIITDALEIVGIKDPNDSLEAPWDAVGLRRINSIIDGWNADKTRGYSVEIVEENLTPNQDTYTVGPGGDFDTIGYPGRPIRIENAFTRSTQGVQYPMRELNFGEFHLLEYPNNKNSYPIGFYYNPKYPLGEVKFYPIPSSNYTVHFDIWMGFGQYSSGTDNVDLPIGYERLLTYQTAVEICSHIGKTPPSEVRRIFKKIEKDIGAINNTLWMPSQKAEESNLNSNWFYMERGV